MHSQKRRIAASNGLNMAGIQLESSIDMQTPPLISKVMVNDEVLGLHLADGRFISMPISFYPTLALATPEERGRFEISGSSVYWRELDANIGVEGLLASNSGQYTDEPLI